MEEKQIKFKLKGHETFGIREGWIAKGLEAVAKDAKVFSKLSGADALGVGVNMAKSIRYWLRATGLTVEKKGAVFLSPVGEVIYKYDPFIEEEFSLWCIHINLVLNKEMATSWYLFFSYCSMWDELSHDGLFAMLSDAMEEYLQGGSYSQRSFLDDFHVLLQMYAKGKLEENDPEDKKICPLSKLGILRKNEQVYKRMEPNLNHFSKEVLLYFLQKKDLAENAISMEDLYGNKEGVGSILGLKKSSFQEYLDMLVAKGYIDVNRTAGLDMVYKRHNMTCEEVARMYYEVGRNREYEE